MQDGKLTAAFCVHLWEAARDRKSPVSPLQLALSRSRGVCHAVVGCVYALGYLGLPLVVVVVALGLVAGVE